jgi:hypothetical protein
MIPLNHAVMGTESAAVDFKMPAPGDAGYDEWRKTGKLPEFQEAEPEKQIEEKKPQVQEHETRSLEEAEDSATPASVKPAASEAARPQKAKKDGEARKAELNQEIRELAKTAADLRKAIAEARQAPPVRETKPEAQPAAEKPEAKAGEAKPEPQLTDKNPDGTPKYKLWGEFQKDHDKWVISEAVREARAATSEHLTKTQIEQKTAEAVAKVDKAWEQKVDKAREKYPDFDTTAKNLLSARDRNGNEFFLPRGSAIDQFLLESPYGADVFHYLAEHANEESVQHIFERTPDGKYFILSAAQQWMALGEIAHTFAAAPVAKPAPSAKPVTKAPPPPHQVAGKPATSLDEAEQAVKEGDQEAFTRIENEKILAKMRQGRRRA